MADNRSQAMLELQQIHMVLEDLTLFLDTHPTDATALKYHAHYQELYEQLVDNFTRQYGPITADRVEPSNSWTWVETPWPWEGEM